MVAKPNWARLDFLRSWHPIGPQNAKTVERLPPVLHRHRPFFGRIQQSQVQQFECRFVIRREIEVFEK
jgi:hypothetical protein